MKARFLAVCLSFFAVSIPVYADITPKSPDLKSTVATSSKIDLNKADVAMLSGSFKGIGKKRAEAIIAYRENHKGFKSIEELAEVKGFGQKYIDTNREKLKEVFVIN